MLRSKRLSEECVGVAFQISPRYLNNPYEPKYIMPGSYALLNRIKKGEKFMFLVHRSEPITLGILCGWLQDKVQYMFAEAGVGEHHVVGINIRNNAEFDMYINLAFKEMVVW